MSKKKTVLPVRPRDELIDENDALRDEVLRLHLRLTDQEHKLAKAEQQVKDLQDQLARPGNVHLALARAAADTFRDGWNACERRARRAEQATSEAQQARERVQLTVSYQAGLLQGVADELGHDDWHTLPAAARAARA